MREGREALHHLATTTRGRRHLFRVRIGARGGGGRAKKLLSWRGVGRRSVATHSCVLSCYWRCALLGKPEKSKGAQQHPSARWCLSEPAGHSQKQAHVGTRGDLFFPFSLCCSVTETNGTTRARAMCQGEAVGTRCMCFGGYSLQVDCPDCHCLRVACGAFDDRVNLVFFAQTSHPRTGRLALARFKNRRRDSAAVVLWGGAFESRSITDRAPMCRRSLSHGTVWASAQCE